MARNVRQSHQYTSIWCCDFTIICVTKKLEVKMPTYISFMSDVHKSYGVENSFASRDVFTYQD